MKDSTKTVNLRLRLPEGLWQKLANEAEKASRSLNSEILFRLNKTLGPEFTELAKAAEERERREHERLEEIMQNPELQTRLSKIVAELWEKRRKK